MPAAKPNLTAADKKWLRELVREMVQAVVDAVERGDDEDAPLEHVGGSTGPTWVPHPDDGARRHGRAMGFHTRPAPLSCGDDTSGTRPSAASAPSALERPDTMS